MYSALINETGNLVVGIADMDVFASITPELVQQYAWLLSQHVWCDSELLRVGIHAGTRNFSREQAVLWRTLIYLYPH